jgi:cobalt-zinc-cadmium efflux system outer membrane protein
MSMRWLVLVCAALLVNGCHSPPLQSIDQTVADFASRPYDVAPVAAPKLRDPQPPANGAAPGATNPNPNPSQATPVSPPPSGNVIRTSYTQVEGATPGQVAPTIRKFELKIPEEIPGSETPLVTLPGEPGEREAAVARLFPQLPPLPEEPVPLPGPSGRPYTLDDLQRLAAANSPALRQAASDVEAARGTMIQAGTYPNPTIGYEVGPNNNNTATGTYAYFFDQVVKTGGKLTLQSTAARMDLRNAELALRRARSDLATQVRTAYYSVVVAQETVRVTKALARYTDEIFRLQTDLLGGNFAASHEPAALRAQAFLIRLGYKQAIASYVYAWKQLVAAIGLRQMPLSEVDGQVDRLIPYYDYDAVLAHVLRNHTDVITARYALQKARYNLKLAQVTPVPDVEVRGDVWKETTILPKQTFLAATVSIPFPIWDRNRGNIMAAEAALVRASEGPHQVEVNLTTGLATAYTTYKTNLAALEYYRRYVLPDQVRYYRGVFERRRIDPNASFGDLVTAQQTLVTDVTAYLAILGQLWTSVVGVADYLQTSDLYQLARPMELPPLPDLEALHPRPCPHPQLVCPPVRVVPVSTAASRAGSGVTGPAAPIRPLTLDQWIARPLETAVAYLSRNSANPGRSPSLPDGLPPLPASTALATPPVGPPYNSSTTDLSRRPGAASL